MTDFSEGYIRGFRAALIDCAQGAEQAASQMDGFMAIAKANGHSLRDSALLCEGADIALKQFAAVIRAKLANLDAMAPTQ